ncbi:MAG: DUF5050 domain-containing protein [Clostridiales bacterium]|nr:DUF5050 domain-containing protein [Clostridiales bacterium]
MNLLLILDKFWKIHFEYLLLDEIISDDEDKVYFQSEEYRGLIRSHMIRELDKHHLVRHKLNDDYSLDINVVDDRIYYKNGNDRKIYSINTDGGDRKLLSDDSAAWLVVGDSRIYYTITGANIYSMNIDGDDKRLLANLGSDMYKDVTYEISARLGEDMPEYRFVATGMTRTTDDWESGYVMGLVVYDENSILLLSADFSQTFYDQIIGNAVYNQMMNTMGLHVVDVNFDGYRDVIILNTFGGAHSNTWYDCWLWNPETLCLSNPKRFPRFATVYYRLY